MCEADLAHPERSTSLASPPPLSLLAASAASQGSQVVPLLSDGDTEYPVAKRPRTAPGADVGGTSEEASARNKTPQEAHPRESLETAGDGPKVGTGTGSAFDVEGRAHLKMPSPPTEVEPDPSPPGPLPALPPVRPAAPGASSSSGPSSLPAAPAVASAPSSRGVEPPPGPIPLAVEWMRSKFGAAWRERFHVSHRLSLARPLVFCRRCGRHCQDVQHLAALGRQCTGEPSTGSTYLARLRYIQQGKHPTTRQMELSPPVPLPPGSRSG